MSDLKIQAFFFLFLSYKIILGILCKSTAEQFLLVAPF